MVNPNISQLVVTTLNNYKASIESNIINNHPLLIKLKEKNNIIKVSGGTAFQENVSYVANGTTQFQGEYDTYDTTPQDVITAADFAQKILTGTVVMTNLEILQNAGKEKIISLMKTKMTNLEESLQNIVGTAIYSDGTGSGGKEIGGLQLLIPDDPTTGTVGNINRATFTFWRPQLFDFSVESVTASATTIQAAMNTLYTRTSVQQGKKVDLIPADSVYFEFYESSLQTIQRIADPTKGKLGFDMLAYKSASVFYDPEAPASHMYFINSSNIFLKHLGEFFATGTTVRPVNQSVWVTPLEFTGNMTTNNSRVHGVMHA